MDYWKQVILAQQQSGLKAREYCRQQDIKYNAFYYWLRKIREEIVEGMPQVKAETAAETQFAVLSCVSSGQQRTCFIETLLRAGRAGSHRADLAGSAHANSCLCQGCVHAC